MIEIVSHGMGSGRVLLLLTMIAVLVIFYVQDSTNDTSPLGLDAYFSCRPFSFLAIGKSTLYKISPHDSLLVLFGGDICQHRSRLVTDTCIQ